MQPLYGESPKCCDPAHPYQVGNCSFASWQYRPYHPGFGCLITKESQVPGPEKSYNLNKKLHKDKLLAYHNIPLHFKMSHTNDTNDLP